MKYEWFPWYPSDFKADTMHLTAEQDGIYRRLIDHYMETERGLPDNDTALARIAGVSEECFKLASSTLRAFFRANDGTLLHKKCEIVLTEMEERYKKLRERAKKGGQARARQLSEFKDSYASSKQQASKEQPLSKPPNPTLPNLTIEKKNIYKKKTEVSEKFLEFWKVYPRHRRGNKEKAWQAWCKAISEERGTEDEIIRGAKSYANSEQGKGDFAKGAAAWLNDDRWNWEVQKPGKYDKNEWPEWKHTLAREIGSDNVASWFKEAELNGESIYVGKQFVAENIRTRFLAQIEKAFEKPYQVVVMEKR